MRRFLLLMAAIVLCFCGCKEDVQQQKKMVMATNATFPPYEYVDKGRIDGIDAEVVRRVAMRLGYELEIQDMAFDSVIAAVQTGKAQVAASGITVTEDRKQKVFFTDTYVIAAQVMIVTKDSPITSASVITAPLNPSSFFKRSTVIFFEKVAIGGYPSSDSFV